jgi:hypothetical protein
MQPEVIKAEVTEILDPSDINVTRILNPFNPREFVREVMPWHQQPLADYFPAGSAEVVVSVNGAIIPKEEFAITYVERGSSLVICPVPQGGGDGDKSIFAMIAMIAVSIFAPYAAGAMMGLEVGTIGYSIAVAGITMAGSMLVHSVFAPSKPTPKNGGGGDTSPTYGIDGAKNTSVEGLPVPICYGGFRMAGNIINLHVENEGDTQNLYVLINAGEGPIGGISDVRLNGNPVGEYKGVEVQTRLGTGDQTVIPWFNDTIIPHAISAKLTTDWTLYSTVGEVDRLRLDFVAPNGLFKVNTADGSNEVVSVPIEVQFKRVGDSAWTTMSMQNMVTGTRSVTPLVSSTGNFVQDENGNSWVWVTDAFGESGRYEPVTGTTSVVSGWVYSDTNQPVSQADLDYINANYSPAQAAASGGSWTVPTYTESATMSAAQRTAVRRSFDTGRLASSKYDVRARRITPKSTEDTVSDEVYLSDVNEIILLPMAYPFTALVGLKMRLGEQISGLPEITFFNAGKLVTVWGRPVAGAVAEQWYEGQSSNPAWIVGDILTNKRYGGGMPTSRIDIPSFKRWAAFCDANGLRWDGPIDTELTVWDATQLVLRIGHAQLVNVGTRYTIVTEAAAAPVMMFSVANMVEGSYKETWLSMSDRANEVDVTFFDKTDNYKQRTIKIYDPAALTAGQKQRTSAVTLYGLTDYMMAYREGMFMMNLNRFVLKTVSFRAPLEAIACTVGDVVYVQHDMPDWAQAGRLEAGSTTTTIKLDRTVTMDFAKTYRFLYLHDVLQRYSGTITNIAGNTVFLSGFDGRLPVKRLKAGSADVRVTEIYGGSVEVESTAGLTVGQGFTLHDTDVIEEVNVVNSGGTTDTLTLNWPLAAAPKQFGNWMFGETSKVKAPFRIKSINTTGNDFTREIQAIQYDDRVYDFSRFDNQHVITGNPAEAVISQVRELEVYEESRVAGAQIISQVIATWRPPFTGNYAGADIVIKINNGAPQPLGKVDHRTSVEIPASRGQTVTVKVIAFDIWGKRAPYDSAPEVTYTVVGEVTNIDVGDVTGADVIWNGRDCRLTWRYNSVTHFYEFGSEPVGADAGSLDPQFKDYEVRVFNMADPPDARPRRVEYVTENAYTYTFEKNHADGLTRRLRFEIRMRDIFNNHGAPAILTAYNPPPRVTSFGAQSTFESANLKYEHTNDPDFAGCLVWLTDGAATNISGDIESEAMRQYLVYDGPDTSIYLSNLMINHDFYVRLAPYDALGRTELIPTDVLHFKTTFLDIKAIADGVLAGSKLIPELQTNIAKIPVIETAVKTETTARQTADSALATQINAVSAIVNNANNSASALVQQEAQARATADSSLASQINTVQSTVNNHTVSIQQQTTAVNGLSGQYTVKIDNNGYVAGFGLASSTNQAGTTTSEFGIRADRMFVILPGYPAVRPFTIGAVNGVPRVIISSALIGDAAINNAKIDNLAVNTHNIQLGACTAAYAAMDPDPKASSVSIGLSIPPDTSFVLILVNPGTVYRYFNEWTETIPAWVHVFINGAEVAETANSEATGVQVLVRTNPAPGSYTLNVQRTGSSSGNYNSPMSVSAQVFKR